jgi:hypothetical protein
LLLFLLCCCSGTRQMEWQANQESELTGWLRIDKVTIRLFAVGSIGRNGGERGEREEGKNNKMKVVVVCCWCKFVRKK